MTTCYLCTKDKPVTDFGIDKRSPTGRNTRCKECLATIKRDRLAAEREANPLPELWPRDPELRRRAELDYQRFYTYGVSPAKYQELFEAQGGVCFVCKHPERERKSMSVDHDHACCVGRRSCGKCVRALLCSSCNSLEGKLAANLELVRQLLAYMELPARVESLPAEGERTRALYRSLL